MFSLKKKSNQIFLFEIIMYTVSLLKVQVKFDGLR